MKTYSNKKKNLNRLLYFNNNGFGISVRDLGSRSRKKFQERINEGLFENIGDKICVK